MYFAYIDESGTSEPQDKNNELYILAAVVMQEKGLNYLSTECDKIKQEIFEIIKNEGDSEIFPLKFEYQYFFEQ